MSKTNKETKAFGRYDNGFTITFENGLVLSTRFGSMNYCENKSATFHRSAARPEPLVSDDVEAAVWLASARDGPGDDRQWVTDWQQDIFRSSSEEDVRGWLRIEDWLQLLDWCREWKMEKK